MRESDMGIARFVILGATGDLASRHLLPALARLDQAGKLPEDVKITGSALENWRTEDFRRHALGQLRGSGAEIASSAGAIVSRLEYRRSDAADPRQIAALLDASEGPALFYLALPPTVSSRVLRTIAETGLPEGSRIVVEKPFGENLSSARELNRLLHETLPETSVYRMDHFLGKQSVQNILGVRFANRVFESLWCADHIEQVQIVWDETRTVENRSVYYDSAGALRDMVQNHLLQLLALVAMEAPQALTERDLRDRKVELLRAVGRVTPEEVRRGALRGRYGAGRIAARSVPAYVEERGVDPGRGTETFAQVTLRVGNPRWAEVPFVLRTGKALARERREIAIRFRPSTRFLFGEGNDSEGNLLRLQLDPDRMSLGVNINGPGDPFVLERIELDHDLAPQELPAYVRLLLDALEGDPTFSIRGDEAEESWRIVEPIIDAWASGDVPLLEYPAGSDGPISDETVP
jgi:glucose-6-phosphate 1-dehydrogenase